MNKNLISLAIATALPFVASTASAVLPANPQLDFVPGFETCLYGGTAPDNCAYKSPGPVGGSWFAMDNSSNGLFEEAEKTLLAPKSVSESFHLGIAQPGSGSHGGPPDGTESLAIDSAWLFFSNTGLHFTANTGSSVNSDDGAGKVVIDMSNWRVSWNSIPEINMGGGIQDCGTTTDGICIAPPSQGNVDIGGTYDNGTGLTTAEQNCFTDNILGTPSDCTAGAYFVFNYFATVPQADPSGFGGVPYAFHMEGPIGVADITPAAFSFTDEALDTQSTLFTSDSVTVTGVDAGYDVAISISGGSYQVNGGSFGTASGVVQLDDTVNVQHTSAAGFSATTDTVLTIGGVADTFSSTTLAEINDETLTFGTQANQALGATVTSSIQTLIVINNTSFIGVDIGEYSINSGTFVTADGTVDPGDTVTLRHTASGSTNTAVTQTLTIGTTDSTFISSTSLPDTTPDAFSFPNDPQSSVALSTLFLSGNFTVAGINTATPISVTGGEYSINGGAFVTAGGTVNNGQAIQVRHTSSAATSTLTTTTLDIGGVTADFRSTTEADDTTPDAFGFVTQTDVTRGGSVASNSIMPSGTNIDAAISITNGEYSLDAGGFTTATGTFSPGQSVVVRHTASASPTTNVVTTLTIGGVNGTFTSTSLANASPVANDDTGNFIDTSMDATIIINVTGNDVDSDGVVSSTVTVLNAGASVNGGNAFSNGDGTVTFTPNTAGLDSFTYTVVDNDGASSNIATVEVTVSTGARTIPVDAFLTILPASIDSTTIAIEPALGSGSWFSMEVKPGSNTHVSVGGFNHLQLDNTQSATTSTPVSTNIDNVWQFFGNGGVHQTTIAPTPIFDDGAGNVLLDFSGWNVSWNGILSIPLPDRAHSGGADGIAVVTCAVDCTLGDSYVLDYFATVPDGDVSGFGNVKYRLHLEGLILDVVPDLGGGDDEATLPSAVTGAVAHDNTGGVVTIVAGDTAASAGNTSGIGLSVADIGVADPKLNPVDGEQCIGGCIDFTVSGLAPGSSVELVIKLTDTIPAAAVYRKLINGVWQDFDTTEGDLVGSALSVGGACQDPGGQFQSGLREFNDCLYLRIKDGGPNDADVLEDGTVTDPSGVFLAGAPNVPTAFTDGCSVSAVPVSLRDRADWLVVAAFIGLMSVYRLKRRRQD